MWNITTLSNGSMKETAITIISIRMNLIVIVFLILLLGAIVWDFKYKLMLFDLNIFSQIVVLIYYFSATLAADNTYNNVKIKATRINSMARVYKQLLVSIISYIIRPFVSDKENGVKSYWMNYYNGIINDDLVFDGENVNYFEKVKYIVSDIGTTDSYCIVDLCSGNGPFYKWLIDNNIKFRCYTGLDFAVDNASLANNASIVKENILVD